MENECVDFPFSIFSFALIAFGTFFVGRDKVNCPAGQEMVLWRTTSARRINRLHTVTNYEYGPNKTEQAAKAYWDRVKNQK